MEYSYKTSAQIGESWQKLDQRNRNRKW